MSHFRRAGKLRSLRKYPQRARPHEERWPGSSCCVRPARAQLHSMGPSARRTTPTRASHRAARIARTAVPKGRCARDVVPTSSRGGRAKASPGRLSGVIPGSDAEVPARERPAATCPSNRFAAPRSQDESIRGVHTPHPASRSARCACIDHYHAVGDLERLSGVRHEHLVTLSSSCKRRNQRRRSLRTLASSAPNAHREQDAWFHRGPEPTRRAGVARPKADPDNGRHPVDLYQCSSGSPAP